MDQAKTDQEDQLNLKADLVTKKICFICNNLRDSDGNEYKHERLGRCNEEHAASYLTAWQFIHVTHQTVFTTQQTD